MPEAAVVAAMKSHSEFMLAMIMILMHLEHEPARVELSAFQDRDTKGALLDVAYRRMFADLILGLRGSAKKEHNCSFFCWESYHYESIDLQNILTEDELRLITPAMLREVERKYFQVLRKKQSAPVDDAGPKSPKWVVVIRGTNLKSPSDIRKDMQIILSTLHKSPAVQCLQIVVDRLVKTVRSDPEQPKLVLTGHSLGAAMGMLVARNIVLDTSYNLECHFFNPPFITPISVISTMVSPFLHTRCGKVVKKGFKVAQWGISKMVNHNLDGGENMRKQKMEYARLSKSEWSPYLYLNANDHICKNYIPNFHKGPLEKLEAGYSVGSGLLGMIIGEIYPFHLLPNATLCIANNRLHGAHKLRAWTRLDLQFKVIKVKEGDVVSEDIGENDTHE